MNKIFFSFKNLTTNKKPILKNILIITILTSIIMFMLVLNSYSNDINKGLAENLMRLHVVANSDRPDDQELKLKVRDAVLNYMNDKLVSSMDKEQSKFIVNENIEKIREISCEKIQEYGKSYNVEIAIGNFPFPTKNYGDITLPAGNYEALQIIIGEGKGANWWCVMFPPLCFVDASHGVVSKSVKGDLENILSKDEYEITTQGENSNNIPIKVKFKIVEVFQGSKAKFTEAYRKFIN